MPHKHNAAGRHYIAMIWRGLSMALWLAVDRVRKLPDGTIEMAEKGFARALIAGP
jgi:hypothetical protein